MKNVEIARAILLLDTTRGRVRAAWSSQERALVRKAIEWAEEMDNDPKSWRFVGEWQLEKIESHDGAMNELSLVKR